MVLSEGPIECVDYGVEVAGDAMQPEFWPGDIVEVHPYKAVIVGESYVFRGREPRVLIRHLVGISPDEWIVIDGATRTEVKLSRKEWPYAHRIVGKMCAPD